MLPTAKLSQQLFILVYGRLVLPQNARQKGQRCGIDCLPWPRHAWPDSELHAKTSSPWQLRCFVIPSSGDCGAKLRHQSGVFHLGGASETGAPAPIQPCYAAALAASSRASQVKAPGIDEDTVFFRVEQLNDLDDVDDQPGAVGGEAQQCTKQKLRASRLTRQKLLSTSHRTVSHGRGIGE